MSTVDTEVTELLHEHGALASSETRRLLSLLADHVTPLPARALAQVWAVDGGADPAALTAARRERHHVTLVHGHVPRLVADGLVTNRDGGVGLTDTGRHAVETVASSSALADLEDRVCAALGNSRRCAVVRVLQELDADVTTLTGLALVVAASMDAETVATVDDATLDDVRKRLHHVHLPKLDAAGLVSYDVESRLVAEEDVPDEVRALVASAADTPDRPLIEKTM